MAQILNALGKKCMDKKKPIFSSIEGIGHHDVQVALPIPLDEASKEPIFTHHITNEKLD